MKLKHLFFILSFTLLINFAGFTDGFIIVPPHPIPPSIPHPIPGTLFPLSVNYHNVEVNIEDNLSTTKIEQEFYNPNNRQLEGEYIFPIPKHAVINKFKMEINGKIVEAELLDAKKAQKIYEDIVRKHLDPALLQYAGQSIFKARIFPIEAHSTKKITIVYTQILDKNDNEMEYIYPLNTEKFSSKPIKEVNIKIHLHSKNEIKNVYSPSHESKINFVDKNNVTINYNEKNSKPNIDYKLIYNTDKSKIGLSLITYKNKQEKEGYFYLNICPGYFIDNKEILPKDIAFVLDTSGSMAGEKLKKAKKAINFCLENLNEKDRFNIIRYSTEASKLFDNILSVSKKTINEAKIFIDELKPIGGTNIEQALNEALKYKKVGNRPYIIIFITDGKPTIGETSEDKLINKIKKTNNENIKIFTFGIGEEINTHLLDKITTATNSYRTYISPYEDMEIKISNFYSKIQSPVLTDIKLNFGNNITVSKIYPKKLSDLFKGSSLSVLGRYTGSGNVPIELSGYINKQHNIFKYISYFPKNKNDNYMISPLWASRRIGYLLDQIRLNGEDKEIVDEITKLAKKYGIITPYTSYLILEDEINTVRSTRNVINNFSFFNVPASKSESYQRDSSNVIFNHNKSMDIDLKNEWKSLAKKSGKQSITTSKEIQALNSADNLTQTKQGQERLNYTDNKGSMIKLYQQVQNINGRALYQAGRYWVDPLLETNKLNKTIKIKFASKKYFELLKKQPELAPILALGQNIKFYANNNAYFIYE